MSAARRAGLFAALLLLAPALASGQDVAVAAASDLQAALPELAARYEQETGRHLRITFGSSGNFVSQIQNGAPFDLYLSADAEYPKRLEQAGLIEPGTITPYATGRLVIWTRRDSGIDIRQGLSALASAAVRRIAIANPEHAPYGRAAVAALRREGIYDAVRGRLVLGENISQAAQFAQSGNADVGIIALSLAVSPALNSSGTYLELAASRYPPIEQSGVVLKSARDKRAAGDFLRFLGRPDSVRYLRASGFDVPQR
jgi:molybdate transport system substrate-binding protein